MAAVAVVAGGSGGGGVVRERGRSVVRGWARPPRPAAARVALGAGVLPGRPAHLAVVLQRLTIVRFCIYFVDTSVK